MSTAVDAAPDAFGPADELDERPPASRMAIALLALAGLLVSSYLTMFKLGMLGEIQCTIGGCEKVQTSQWSMFLGLPVSAWGVGAYVAILALALAGVQPRFARAPWIARALFWFSLGGVVFSAYLTYLEAFVIHAWCQWCVISAILITLIFFFSIPGFLEARRANRA